MEAMGRVVKFEKLTEGKGKDIQTLYFMNTLFSSHNPVPIKRNTVNLGQRRGQTVNRSSYTNQLVAKSTENYSVMLEKSASSLVAARLIGRVFTRNCARYCIVATE